MNQTVKEIGKKVVALLPTKPWLSWQFKKKFGRKINWENPTTFNEKLQWLKVYNRNPIHTEMVDKYAVKKLVSDLIGEKYIIPTLGVWDRFEDIDFDVLPDQFVLKCTHDSGGLVIVRDKSKMDKAAAKKKFKIALNRNPYDVTREWPYKNVRPRIIAEQYMQDGETSCLPVYKILNFGGEPKIIQAIQNDKTPEESIDYFDTNWNKLDLRQNYPNSATPLERPAALEEMLSLAERLSGGMPLVRTDFYTVNGKVYFSEFTFFSDSGFAKFNPPEWDDKLGGWITLPEKNERD